jgi:hypothetical protein
MNNHTSQEREADMSPIELAAFWPPTASAAREAGHKPQSPLRAIRDKCLDWSCYQPSEIRLCEAIGCPLWPFRAGRHPWHAASVKREETPAVKREETPANFARPCAPLPTPTPDAGAEKFPANSGISGKRGPFTRDRGTSRNQSSQGIGGSFPGGCVRVVLANGGTS